MKLILSFEKRNRLGNWLTLVTRILNMYTLIAGILLLYIFFRPKKEPKDGIFDELLDPVLNKFIESPWYIQLPIWILIIYLAVSLFLCVFSLSLACPWPWGDSDYWW